MYQMRNMKEPSREAGFRSVHTATQIFFLLIEGTISKKNKHSFVGHRMLLWHWCLPVSLRCLSSVS